MVLFVIIWLFDNASKDQSVICQVEYNAPMAIYQPSFSTVMGHLRSKRNAMWGHVCLSSSPPSLLSHSSIFTLSAVHQMLRFAQFSAGLGNSSYVLEYQILFLKTRMLKMKLGWSEECSLRAFKWVGWQWHRRAQAEKWYLWVGQISPACACVLVLEWTENRPVTIIYECEIEYVLHNRRIVAFIGDNWLK